MRLHGALMLFLFAPLNWAEADIAPKNCGVQTSALVVSLQGTLEYDPESRGQWRSIELNQKLCEGSRIHVGPFSRASVLLPAGIVARIDEDTVLTFNVLAPDKTTLMDLLKGFVHFISRTPKHLQINTPIANAGPEGTEFALSVNEQSASLWVYEGGVKFFNNKGSVSLKPGQGAQTRSGQAPQARIDIKSQDAVNWALYYPPLLPYPETSTPIDKAIRNAIRDFRQGRTVPAITELNSLPPNKKTPFFYKVRAAMLLIAGRVDLAENDIQSIYKQNPKDAEAFALQSVLALTQNRKEEAYALAVQAIASDPKSASAYSALSYAEQGRFELDKALQAATQAATLAPHDAMVWARKAELELALGLTSDTKETVQQAEKLDAELERTQTIIGFYHLQQMEANDAKEAFEKALILDSTSPLARLGLGLAKIRNGDLEQGRQDLEIAAALDPNNSMIRSYLGKAYYEEKRNPLAEDQFKLAKERDPKDPTPYFYDAIRKQTYNRPVEALQDMQKAIELNNNRAVTRSKLMLDQDTAARTANLARTYNDLGFGRVAFKEAWKSLAFDSTNPTAHRFLSDAYIGQPRYRAARASELLQAQLLQSINITPVQPQLTSENIGILNSTGPGSLSLNEYDSLYNANGAHVVLNGAYGSRNTKTDNAIISGVYDNISGSLGQFHYQTDGFRKNDGYQQDIYDAFIQYAFTKDFSAQLELKSDDIKAGDVPFRLNDDISHRDKFKQTIKQDSLRLGSHLKLTPTQDLIGSFSYLTLQDNTYDQQTPILITNNINISESIKTYQAEVQHIFSNDYYTLTSGLDFVNFTGIGKQSTTQFINNTPLPIDPKITPFNDNGNFYNGYFYLNNKFIPNLSATIGLSLDSFESQLFDRQQINPKFGLIWNPLSQLAIRGALFRTLKKPLVSNQTIEPTQVAGFNQFFDEFNGTTAWQYSLGFDYRLLNNLYFGGEFNWRKGINPKSTIGDNTVITFLENFKQSNHLAYLYLIPNEWLSIKSEYHFDYINRGLEISENDLTLPVTLTTHQIPLSINFFHPSGLYAKLSGTFVDQNVFGFLNKNEGLKETSERFWTFDATVGYRLPKKIGVVSFEMRNLFNNHFKFQSAFDSSGPQISPFVPERQLFAKISFFY